ncbi:MAG: ankyrin repeat domain-containing protein [Candidatus Krumholzibacteria bacterium]|nr:ankyrin repeat domain-containing protein [Candidatus Krumholzibacteria bacterium]
MKTRSAILVGAIMVLFSTALDAQEIHTAATSGDTAKVRELIRANGRLLEMRDTWGRTPLCAASRDGGDAATIRLLVSLGADVNAADNSGWTPIMLAAWRPYKDVVEVLLDAGAELPVSAQESTQILKDAAEGGLERLFDALIARGASVDTAGTLLHSAAGGGSPRIVESLIGRGFDVNKKDKFGWEPLHIAAEQGHREIISFLLARGADIDARNMLGQTPYNIAQDRDDRELMSYLESAGAETADPAFPKIKGKYLGRPRPGLTPQESVT